MAIAWSLALRGRLPELKTLLLNDTFISDDAIESLATFRMLEILRVDGTRITGANFHLLATLPQLKMLHIDRTSVANESLEPLRLCPKLETLTAESTGVDGSGALTLRLWLQCRDLLMDAKGHGLALTIQDRGAPAKPLLCAFFSDGGSIDAALICLRSAARQVQLPLAITIESNSFSDSVAWTLAEYLKKSAVECIRLVRCDIAIAGLAELAALHCVKELDLVSMSYREEVWEALIAFRSLVRLSVPSCCITMQTVAYLQQMRMLEVLSVYGELSDGISEYIARHVRLLNVKYHP